MLLVYFTFHILQHGAICQFPSKTFYEEQLETDESVRKGYKMFLQKNRFLESDFWVAGPDRPIMFCDVEGKESTGKKADRNIALQSKSNEMEADCMVRVKIHACFN